MADSRRFTRHCFRDFLSALHRHDLHQVSTPSRLSTGASGRRSIAVPTP